MLYLEEATHDVNAKAADLHAKYVQMLSALYIHARD